MPHALEFWSKIKLISCNWKKVVLYSISTSLTMSDSQLPCQQVFSLIDNTCSPPCHFVFFSPSKVSHSEMDVIIHYWFIFWAGRNRSLRVLTDSNISGRKTLCLRADKNMTSHSCQGKTDIGCYRDHSMTYSHATVIIATRKMSVCVCSKNRSHLSISAILI